MMINETCQLCGETAFTLLHDQGRGKRTVHNYLCTHCGFICIFPRPTEQKLQSLYIQGEFSEHVRSSTGITIDHWELCEKFALRREHYVRKVCPSPKKLLEIGCGSGNFLLRMRRAGWQCEGLEPDGKYAADLQKIQGLPTYTCFLKDFQPGQTYDLIASFHVIEHVDDINDFINSITQNLAPQGKVVLEYPAFETIYTGDINTFFWDAHINTFTQETIRALLVKNGFDLEQQGKSGNFYYTIAQRTIKKTPVIFTAPDELRIRAVIRHYDSRRLRYKVRASIRAFGHIFKRALLKGKKIIRRSG